MKKLTLILLLINFTNLTLADTITPLTTTSATDTTKGAMHSYYFRGETLEQVLNKQAKQNGLNISIAGNMSTRKLASTVSGRFSASDYSDLLSQLSKLYGFNFYTYSGTLFITSISEQTKSIAVAGEDMPMLKNGLSELGILNPKFGYTEFPAENKIVVRGPSSYVNAISEQISNLKISPSKQQFAVYRLRYANVTDTQLSFNNQTVTIPGVATILQNVLNGNQSTTTKTALDNSVLEPIKNQLTTKDGTTSNIMGSNLNNSVGGNGIVSNNALIQADNRLNTIVIRDKPSNLEIYKNLIALLDVPSPLIQIEVLIIHLDQNELNQAGINWWASKNGYATGFGANNLSNSNPGSNLSFYYGQINPGQLLVNNVNNFVASLDYLTKHDIATASAKPSLATTDNLPAIINVTENIYPATPQNSSNNGNSGASSNSSSNSPIQVTTALEITPHVIFDDNNNCKIKLSINLQDGSINEQTINSVPTTTQSTLNSQAVINENQSIILGGYTKNVTEEVTNQVPYLGSIPILGWFFKSKSSVNRKLTSLYLVTPRIVWIDNTKLKYKDYIMVNGNKFKISHGYDNVR